MSGSAALSAAKRRRAVATDDKPTTSSSKTTKQNTTRPTGQQINPLQVLNQHHMKLDVLYQRQDKINKILNIEHSLEGEEEEDKNPKENLIVRVEKLETQITNKTHIGDENELLQQITDYKTQVDELRNIILNVQAHSINLSLEMLELKKNTSSVKVEMENSDEISETESVQNDNL